MSESEVEKRSRKSAGDAGEYYVAYMLSRMGVSAALTTSGTSAVDIIATIDGSKSISIQVKASWGRNQRDQWTVGVHKPVVSPDFFYVFCNINEDVTNDNLPEVYVVPSKIVEAKSTWHTKVPVFKIGKAEQEQFLHHWSSITEALKKSTSS